MFVLTVDTGVEVFEKRQANRKPFKTLAQAEAQAMKLSKKYKWWKITIKEEKVASKMTGFQSKKAAATEKLVETQEIDLQRIMLGAIKDLTMAVENLKQRVEIMEKYQRDDGK